MSHLILKSHTKVCVAIMDMTSALWDMTSDKPGLREAESSAQSKAVTDTGCFLLYRVFSEVCPRRSNVKFLQIRPFYPSLPGVGDIH